MTGEVAQGGLSAGPPAPFRDAVAHGGRLAAAMAAYPDAPGPWLDLSTGINPDPWDGPRASRDELARLPDPAGVAALEAIAARAFGVADPSRVVATAGAEAALRWLPVLIPAKAVQIVSPTYGGHEAAWRAAGRIVREADGVGDGAADALLLVNPNNPDGRAIAREDLAAVAEDRAWRRAWTIVDESFVETRPELSVAGLASNRLIVLRSFGKFYGLAGLRLGFLIGPTKVAAGLRALQGDWPICAEAVAMGARAYADDAWRARTQARLKARAAELDALLVAAGLEVLGGTSLFRLARTPDAAAVFDRLCRAGVLTRPFAGRLDWLRFGLPRAEDLPRLAEALR